MEAVLRFTASPVTAQVQSYDTIFCTQDADIPMPDERAARETMDLG